MPKVSVLMPTLNVAPYIVECMESVINQTLRDIEIIVVDAGSTDGTYEILQKYAKKDHRIRVVYSEKRSYGYQMNLALSFSTGKYIAFVETDDFIEPDMLEMLARYADEYTLDYAKGNTNSFWNLKNGDKYIAVIDTMPVEPKTVFCPKDMPELLLTEYHFWTGIYRRSFLEGIHFNETAGAAFQDIGFIVQVLNKARRAMYVDCAVYWYRCNNDNSSVFNPKGFQYLMDEYSFVLDLDLNCNELWENVIYLRWFAQTLGRFQTMAISGRYWPDAEKQIEFIKNAITKKLFHKNIPFYLMGDEYHALLKLFMISGREVYDYYVEKYSHAIAAMKRITSWASGHSVIIYGCGNWGGFAHALLDLKCGVDVKAFTDSNKKIYGSLVQGLPVISPEEAKKRFPDACYLIASSRGKDTIRKKLLSQGIREDFIHWERLMTDEIIFQPS